MRRDRRESGFTLIELMMVIAIVMALFSMSMPSLLGARRAAYETGAIEMMRSVIAGEEAYKGRNLGGTGLYGTIAQLEAKKLVTWPVAGTYVKNYFTFTDLLVAPTASQWGVLAVPDILLHGDRDFVGSNDGYIRWQSSALAVPATLAAGQALTQL